MLSSVVLRSVTVLLCAVVELMLSQCLRADDPNYAAEVQPILARKCYSCHGPGHAESGLRLHTRDAATAAVDSGEQAIVPGEPKQSELLKRVTATDDTRMPPEGKALTDKEVAVLRAWIAAGAEFADHWSFQPLKNPPTPTVQDTAWPRDDIDRFVLNKLEAAGLKPVAPAEKATWLRRATYDLIGLPPTGQELREFLADNSPQAEELVIDRLLASPHYGERWARHWLDLVRYAETNSFERDGLKPNAWRYRDYVIRSLNEDKPYDQFIREQLAGDEFAEPTHDSLIATGYYRLGLWDDEPADRLQARYDELDDIVSNVGQVFLGLTVNCARCHDHKIDPLTQRDYYQMLAVFHEIQAYGGSSQKALPDENNSAKSQAWEQAVADIKRQLTEYHRIALQKIPLEEANAIDPVNPNGPHRERLRKLLEKPDLDRYNKLRKQLGDLERDGPDLQKALVVTTVKKPPQTFIFARGNPHSPTEECQPAAPNLFGKHLFTVADQPRFKESSGRRTALADWIASPDNWLTARVIANRIWQHHFGRGIVRSTNNFGMLGTPPTHPELLNRLASDLIAGGWRLKSLHKRIMLSQTYRLSTAGDAVALTKDPANDLLWRFDQRRLSAEEIRDTMHVLTGEFNPAMYGPGYYPTIQAEVLAGQSRPGSGWGKSTAEEQARRSIYIHVKRSLVTPILSTFDFPETDSSCEARFNTTQPGQALTLINSDFMQQRADKLAERVRKIAGDDGNRVLSTATQLVLNREPTAAELVRGRAFLERLAAEPRALALYCLTLFNRNELLFVE